jgi:transcriptional regulator GlxA family with amidase domain
VGAVRFAADNPTEPLAEELEFDIVRFYGRAGLHADEARQVELLRRKYPRNARLVGLASGQH